MNPGSFGVANYTKNLAVLNEPWPKCSSKELAANASSIGLKPPMTGWLQHSLLKLLSDSSSSMLSSVFKDVATPERWSGRH